ncbi:MAG: hypothetical protein QOG92_2, partial [Verrucomicrobiota bacterium]|nr:hypothetical protein [Verrucomicrobiota bacterium]
MISSETAAGHNHSAEGICFV